MKYALFVLIDKETQAHNPTDTRWRDFVGELGAALETHKGNAERLNPLTFLIPLTAGLHTLADLSEIAHRCGVPSQTLFFETEPNWVETAGMKPKGKSLTDLRA